MRSVMALSPQRLPAALKAVSTRFRRRTAWAQRGRVIAPAVRWRHERRRRALRPRSCHCLDGRTPTARRARWTSLFGVDLWRADETKKARSVVALSCVPRGERGTPVSPPATGRCSGRGSLPIRGPCLGDVHPPRANPRPWRLSGLLSGCPPTGTRPQARAELGRGVDTDDASAPKGLFRHPAAFSVQTPGGGRARGGAGAPACPATLDSTRGARGQ